MLEILEFIFSSGWVWLGVTVWIVVIAAEWKSLVNVKIVKHRNKSTGPGGNNSHDPQSP